MASDNSLQSQSQLPAGENYRKSSLGSCYRNLAMGNRWNSWYLPAALGILSMFSFTALLLILVGIHNVTLPPDNKYGLVFDAGSSHTSLFIYQWPVDKENNTGVVSQTFSCYVKGGGISSYAENPPQAGASLEECLDAAMTVIPRERQQETPVYLGATAGMRLLRMENESASKQVLEEVAKTIKQYPVSFQGAQIISGNDEGAYGWITINYLLDSFTKYSAKDRGWIHPPSTNILGALDLGGASTQISFVPAGQITDPNEAAHFRLYGFDYTIYTHSYLCYGQNQAFQHLIRILINSSSSDRIDHPCYPKGYTSSITTESVYSSPCAKQSNPPPASKNFTLVGTGNAILCREAFKSIFNFTNYKYNISSGFNGVYQPKVNGKFLAFSAYYYTFNFLNLTETQPLATVEDTIKTFCARDWDEVKSTYSSENEAHLKNYCASANYILTILLDGYGFGTDTWNNIAFQMRAANSEIGWTLGYMLNLTNMVPSEAPLQLKGQEEPMWAANVFFIAAVLAICMVLLMMYLLR
ncbi:ectonucleoside triphosphate diphosphohydrolase 8 [Zootoca vivipara]|uniref:ectonucleoside triphosphate diphosphohydrolase 8 n=1 Tax=Zootoca vivipara TaxID=8524 RepID=UPI0015912CB5|nr:ectonucleoside triphosphate diphosphohydrolase 8 [Zootoca vivipara]XP_034969624.1 ectonucleoside triphosphate diphosphohydrolase 8 [Zootoca vivipara]